MKRYGSMFLFLLFVLLMFTTPAYCQRVPMPEAVVGGNDWYIGGYSAVFWILALFF